jgi:hypothetical protein
MKAVPVRGALDGTHTAFASDFPPQFIMEKDHAYNV